MNELTPYELFQLERYGDIISEQAIQAEHEAGLVEEQRFSEWMELQNEIQLEEYD